MKKSFFWVALIAIPLTAAFAAATWVGSKSDGYHFGTSASAKLGFYDATPIVQQAATVTPYSALVNLGLLAPGTSDLYLQHKQVALTAANLNGMYGAPVALIAAPGSGKSIVVQRLAFTITRTATAFLNGGAVIVQYAATTHGGGTQALDSTIAATELTGAAGTSIDLRNGAVISAAASTVTQNVGLYISNASGAFDTGTGTATVDVWYYVY